MATDLPIVMFSRARAGVVSTLQFFPDAMIVVPENEVPIYREHYPDNEIIAQPSDVVGLGPARQWMWDRLGDVFMVDDDLTHLVDLGAAPGESTRCDPKMAYPLVQRNADMARQMGVKMFGFNPHDRPEGYVEHRPYRLAGFTNFSNTGLFGDTKLFIHPELSLYDDFWLCLLNAYYYRYMLIDMRYAFSHKDTFHNPGGLATVRNTGTMRRSFDLLKQMFGDAVEEKVAKGDKEPWAEAMARIVLPYKG